MFADNLGHVVSRCLGSMEEVPGIGFIAVFAFAFQIYCDFSAYTDIARGSAKFFNIELSRNFLTPYFATSPADFWRRWHISLSTWIRDYLYIPVFLKLRRLRETLRLSLTLILTMALMGLWHGAGIFFVWWGLYHGFLLVLYRYIPLDKILRNRFHTAGHLLSIAIMFSLTCFGWALFMSDPSTLFPELMKNLAWFFVEPWDPRLITWVFPTIMLTAPVIFADCIGYDNKCEFVDLYDKFSFRGRVFVFLLMFYAVCILGKREPYDFIYFAF